MKLFKLTALSALLMITLSGCSLNSESPEQLIKEKPVYSEASLKLYKQIWRKRIKKKKKKRRCK